MVVVLVEVLVVVLVVVVVFSHMFHLQLPKEVFYQQCI